MTPPVAAPSNVEALRRRIDNHAHREQISVAQLQRLIANVVIGQMMPLGVIRGGAAMKIRVGDAGVRFTRDLDVSRAAGIAVSEFIDDFAERLDVGWYGFTGRIESLTSPSPPNVPDDYLIRRYRVRLSYLRSSWVSVHFELGNDDVGGVSEADACLAPSIIDVFDALGLVRPNPVKLLSVRHQIAQKLHACTDTNSDNQRAHDLVDLQLLMNRTSVDVFSVREACVRLFASRKGQQWPPIVRVMAGWKELYDVAAYGLDVLPTVQAAVEWANEFVALIDRSRASK